MEKISRIGVLTSGGDSPGMNAAIRAVVRAATHYKLEAYGISRGYEGMIQGQIEKLESHHVSDIIQRGGTMLKTARCKDFMTVEGRAKAHDQLKAHGIDAVVVIGGDGSFRGARAFSEEHNIPFVGIPGTIDNDLYGTDYAIGYDTAINTVVQAVDKIRDTASSHDRLFFIEVMGRDAGFIALRSGIACGAEAILIPEIPTHLDQLTTLLKKGYEKKKTSSIILVAEGDDAGGAFEIAAKVKENFKDYDVRVTILGHIQRGGAPSAFDRYLASVLGVGAVKALLDNKKNIMVGFHNREVVHISFSQTVKHHKTVKKELVDIIEILNA